MSGGACGVRIEHAQLGMIARVEREDRPVARGRDLEVTDRRGRRGHLVVARLLRARGRVEPQHPERAGALLAGREHARAVAHERGPADLVDLARRREQAGRCAGRRVEHEQDLLGVGQRAEEQRAPAVGGHVHDVADRRIAVDLARRPARSLAPARSLDEDARRLLGERVRGVHQRRRAPRDMRPHAVELARRGQVSEAAAVEIDPEDVELLVRAHVGQEQQRPTIGEQLRRGHALERQRQPARRALGVRGLADVQLRQAVARGDERDAPVGRQDRVAVGEGVDERRRPRGELGVQRATVSV
jgi:predicted CoA-binding protein